MIRKLVQVTKVAAQGESAVLREAWKSLRRFDPGGAVAMALLGTFFVAIDVLEIVSEQQLR
jgi:hypothetical protein